MSEVLSFVAGVIVGLIPFLYERHQQSKKEAIGEYHLNQLDDHQRFVLIEMCKEYEKTGRPVPWRKLGDLWSYGAVPKYGQYQRIGGNPLVEMLDDMVNRGQLEKAGESPITTYTPTDLLMKQLRRKKLI